MAGTSGGGGGGGEEARPLLALVRALVSTADEEANTVLSNSQLLDILQREFGIAVSSPGVSALELDIYVNVLKKFLKSWPRWDEFDHLVKRSGRDPAVRETLLQEEYVSLKRYLQQTLALTEGQASSIIAKLNKQRSKHIVDVADASRAAPASKDDPGVVLEVTCSRDQLNRLFYRKPHPASLSIFHIATEPSASKISLESIKLKEILNWPHVAVHITLPDFAFVRKNSSHFERTLINKKLPENQNRVYKSLSSDLYWKNYSRKTGIFKKNVIVSFLVQLIVHIDKMTPTRFNKEQIMEVFHEIKSDLLSLTSKVHLMAEYQFFMNTHPYVRHLCKEIPETESNAKGNKETEKLKESIESSDFDLELEEVISPAMTFQVTKFAVKYSEDISGRKFNLDYTVFNEISSNWLKVECMLCEQKFDGFLSMYQLEQHFLENHSWEPDWECTKCQKYFTMNFLAANRWTHTCTK